VNKYFDKKLFKAIFDSYFRQFHSKNNLTLWLCKTLMKLMNLLEVSRDKELIKDALIIVLNLMKDTPLDLYHKNTKNFKEMTLIKRLEVRHLLKNAWDFK
jgi:hypothetical protein